MTLPAKETYQSQAAASVQNLIEKGVGPGPRAPNLFLTRFEVTLEVNWEICWQRQLTVGPIDEATIIPTFCAIRVPQTQAPRIFSKAAHFTNATPYSSMLGSNE